MTRRSDEEILLQTNSLASKIYELRGYKVNPSFSFYGESVNRHPDETFCWNVACLAQEELTNTEIDGNLEYLYDLSVEELKKAVSGKK